MKSEDKKKLLQDFFKFFIEKGEMSCNKNTVDYFVDAFLNESPLSDTPEEIDCPWCDGNGWIVEPDEQNEPAQVPCMPCDLHGRMTTTRFKEFWAQKDEERLREKELEGDDDLPF